MLKLKTTNLLDFTSDPSKIHLSLSNKHSPSLSFKHSIPKSRHFKSSFQHVSTSGSQLTCQAITSSSKSIQQNPILIKNDLIQHLLNGCKPKDQWRY